MVGKIQDCMVSFLSESGVPFAQINSINRKTAAKSWNWYQRWLEETEHEFLFGTFRPGKQDTFWDVLSLLEIWKIVYKFLSNPIFSNFKLNGKQPRFTTQWDKFETQCHRLFVLFGDPEVMKLALHEIKILAINATFISSTTLNVMCITEKKKQKYPQSQIVIFSNPWTHNDFFVTS